MGLTWFCPQADVFSFTKVHRIFVRDYLSLVNRLISLNHFTFITRNYIIKRRNQLTDGKAACCSFSLWTPNPDFKIIDTLNEQIKSTTSATSDRIMTKEEARKIKPIDVNPRTLYLKHFHTKHSSKYWIMMLVMFLLNSFSMLYILHILILSNFNTSHWP